MPVNRLNPPDKPLLRRLKRLLLTGLFAITLVFVVLGQPSVARLPGTVPTLAQFSLGSSGSSSSGQEHVSGWIELDGRQVFQISAPKSSIKQRQARIETNLQRIRDDYLQAPSTRVEVRQISSDGLPSLYVDGSYLMTVTEKDGEVQGTSPWAIAEDLQSRIPEELEQARQERQPEVMRHRSMVAGAIMVVALAIAWLLARWSDRVLRWVMRGVTDGSPHDHFQEQQWHHLQDLQMRLLPLVQAGILIGALFWVAGLFPQTRELQQELPVWTKLPLMLAILIVVAYIGIRISYALTDRFVGQFTGNELYDDVPRRVRLRVSTITSVVKNVATLVWIILGLIAALALTGIDIGVLLASISVIGLAISLAAKGVIKGAINGFFIILEDQFAIGDVVKIGEYGGQVENMNLRITQMRDAGGRLVSIPMAEITEVANYSLRWSRADLKLPVSYKANIDELLDLLRDVGQEMMQAEEWRSLILEEPSVLGVDDFGDSSVIIRVWIKTKPMKQWDVEREFRRRFKLAMQGLDDTSIPFPQRDIWLHPASGLQENLEGWFDQMASKPAVQVNGSVTEENGNGHQVNGHQSNGNRDGSRNGSGPSKKLQPTFNDDGGDDGPDGEEG